MSMHRGKRKVDDTEPHVQPVLKSRNWRLLHATKKLGIGQQNDEFREKCTELMKIEFVKLNNWLQECLTSENIPQENIDRVRYVNTYEKSKGRNTYKDRPTFAFVRKASEYLRMAQNIMRLYGCSVQETDGEYLSGGEIVAMGNDDTGQIGIVGEELLLPAAKNASIGVILPILKSNDFRSLRIPRNNIRSISAGGIHSVALTLDGNAYTWGASEEGTLGRESVGVDEVHEYIAPENKPGIVTGFTTKDGEEEDGTIIKAVAGDSHILFLTLAGNVYQCGFYKDVDSGKFCDGRIEGFNEKPVHIDQLTSPVKDIFTRACFNVALLTDDTIVTWGFGCKGELARSATMTKPEADGMYDLTKNLFYYLESGKPNPDILKEHFLKPLPPLWKATNIVQQKKVVLNVATGSYHLLVTAREAFSDESHLYSSGLNNYGQLGHGDNTDRHELTLVEALREQDIVKVAAGQHHSLALSLIGYDLFAFGRTDYGQLGLGIRIGEEEGGSFQSTPILVPFPKVPGTDPPAPQIITSIACGDLHSIAITIENNVYTWGFNVSGATGHKYIDSKDVCIPTLLDLSKCVGGKNLPHVRAYEVSGGGQHTLMLVKQFRSRPEENEEDKSTEETINYR